MKRHLIIDGTAVYEIDEDCMLKKRVDKDEDKETSGRGRFQWSACSHPDTFRKPDREIPRRTRGYRFIRGAACHAAVRHERIPEGMSGRQIYEQHHFHLKE